MKVLVLGGNGFIGQKLLSILIKNKTPVVLVTRKSFISTDLIRAYRIDLLDPTVDFLSVLDGVTCIYNCAGELKNESLMHDLHVKVTQTLLQAIKEKIASVGQPIHWVQLSSVGAYGPPQYPGQPRVITEETLCNPQGIYEVTKTSADRLIMSLHESEPLFSFTILRPSNVIGSAMPNQSFKMLLLAIHKKAFFYIGFKQPISTYISVDDVAYALFLCGNNVLAKGHVFNLSNDCFLYEIVEAVVRVRNKKQDIPIVTVPIFFARIIATILSIMKLPYLTHSRVNALIQQTRYPSTKIGEILAFTPSQSIPALSAMLVEEKL